MKLIFPVLLFLASAVCVAEEEMDIQWSDGDEGIRQLLQDNGVFQDGVEFINDTFRFNRPLTLHIGADDGPLYDPEKNIIQMPYEFYADVVELFAEIEPGNEALQHEYAIDTMLHTLFHEYGHVAIDQFEIPVLGREEDAVDGLASVLLIEYYDNGADMALSAAELFALESEERGAVAEEDFWGEHSLDEQRYYSTLCHVYGSDPARYEEIIEFAGFSDERADACEFEYQQLVDGWDKLMQPILK